MSLSRALAKRRLDQLRERHGDLLIAFAAAAALPAVLDARLVHLLRINFFLDTGQPLPWTVESDLLFSPLCSDVGDGLFEIEPAVRELLLAHLIEEQPGRIQDIASLLWAYVHQRPAPWADEPQLERAQALTALHMLDPVACEAWLEHAQTEVNGDAQARRPWFVAMQRKLEPWTHVMEQRVDRLAPPARRGEQARDQLNETGVDFGVVIGVDHYPHFRSPMTPGVSTNGYATLTVGGLKRRT
jgi:hypothetical protein